MAKLAHDKKNPEFERMAWIAQGYADHFLEDSFAAGHLINKTLVMQWFIEWVADKKSIPVTDWDEIKDMTTTKQPNIGGLKLYDLNFQYTSCDPQTAQEGQNLQNRVTASSINGSTPTEVMAAYCNYLTFMTSAVAQLSSANIHDHYNENSVLVSSTDHEKFKVWGDNTLLTGPEGKEGITFICEALQLSQKAIRDIIQFGSTTISYESIQKKFPIKAQSNGSFISLKEWALSQKDLCLKNLFPAFGPAISALMLKLASPRLEIMSQDQAFARIWYRSLPDASFEKVIMLPFQNRLFCGTNGQVYELDPLSGKVIWNLPLSDMIGVGDYTTRLSIRGTTLFAGVHGYIYAVDINTHKILWYVGVGNTGWHPVSVCVYSNSLFVGCNTYVYEFNPADGKIKNQVLLSETGVGDYETHLDVNDDMVFAATHGFVYGIKRQNWKKYAWYVRVGGNIDFELPNVLIAGKQLFAGCNGYVYEIDPERGTLKHQLLITDIIGQGNYETRLAYDGITLFAGVHGDWKAASWYIPMDGITYNPVSVQVLNGRVFVGSNGSVFEINLSAHTFKHRLLLSSIVGIGDYDTHLMVDGNNFFAGVHGYAYSVSIIESKGVLTKEINLSNQPTTQEVPTLV
jgi:hypothetical protein